MTVLLECNNITKKFPGVTALDNVSFDVREGEVHCLVGENGAGKSTLMKILSGVYTPTSGSIKVNGKEYNSFTPAVSQENGISIIYQELSLVETLSIQENIFIGKIPTTGTIIKTVDYKGMEEKTKSLLTSLGLNRSPQTLVSDLSISEKQIVEIAKAIAFDAKIIIMDEPTSSLVSAEIKHLLKIVMNLKKQGHGIIYISHKMDELFAIGDRMTILKDGKSVSTVNAEEVTEDDVVRMMVGRDLLELDLVDDVDKDKIIFSAENLTRKDGKIRNISFNLYQGEILGFSGLVGAGRTELVEAIYGAAKLSQGTMMLNGKKVAPKSPYEGLKAGIGLVTENRRQTGFSPFFNIAENVSQAKFIYDSKWQGLVGLIDRKLEDKLANKQVDSLQVKCSSKNQIITELSGGNQQKVILGRWLSAQPELLIFDEPTKGIDVGTKSEIYRIMRELARNGIGVLVVSSEMPELLKVCDRIAVIAEGQITAFFDNKDATEENLLRAAALTS